MTDRFMVQLSLEEAIEELTGLAETAKFLHEVFKALSVLVLKLPELIKIRKLQHRRGELVKIGR